MSYVIGNISDYAVTKRQSRINKIGFICYTSLLELKNMDEAFRNESWITVLQKELNQFVRYLPNIWYTTIYESLLMTKHEAKRVWPNSMPINNASYSALLFKAGNLSLTLPLGKHKKIVTPTPDALDNPSTKRVLYFDYFSIIYREIGHLQWSQLEPTLWGPFMVDITPRISLGHIWYEKMMKRMDISFIFSSIPCLDNSSDHGNGIKNDSKGNEIPFII